MVRRSPLLQECTQFANSTRRDPSVVPPNGSFPGMLVLGRQTPGSENLNLGKLQSFPFLLRIFFISPKDQPLAAGFSLRDGLVRVTCPTVSPGNNYIVVCKCAFLTRYVLLSISYPVFGDSGNVSPQFTISGPSESDSPASGPSPNHDVASPNTQPSSAGLAPSPPASTLSTSVPTSTSGPLVLALTMSPSTSPTVPQAESSPAGHTSLSPSSPKESTSSSAPTAFIGPPPGLNSNDAISRIRNPGAMIGGAVVSVFTIFLL